MSLAALPSQTLDLPEPAAPAARSQVWIHRLLCLLVLDVIFEGLGRKLAPPILGIWIFFSKDVLTVLLLILCLKSPKNEEASHWLRVMGCLFWLLLPCVLLTAVRDPLLAVFGLKQYALFPTVAVAVSLAYASTGGRQLTALLRLTAFSIVITTCVAVLQNRLPASHWLNLSVAGDDLSVFSAGGYLRVSSTFPFVGQYCFYLNAMCYCVAGYFYLTKWTSGRTLLVQTVVLVALLAVGSFVTGSRASVIGNAAIFLAAGLLSSFVGGAKALVKLLGFIAFGAVLLGWIVSQFPELFAAYQARTSGSVETSHALELQQRIRYGLFGWIGGWEQAPPTLLGYGLGVMSNGSDRLSAYAAAWRASGFWTETDQGTTFFEGGWYLVCVWYGFRCWVVLHCFTRVRQLRALELRLMGCFALAFISVLGVVGTLAMQPPLAIWWWLAVGLVTCLGSLDREPAGESVETAD